MKIMNMMNYVMDFIFPRTSIISGQRLKEKNSNDYIDDFEFESLRRTSSDDLDDLKSKVDAEYSFSLLSFYEDDEFSKIIYKLKYGGMKKLGIFLGRKLGESLKEHFESDLSNFDFLIPVPLFKTKLRERGYNQSEYLCSGINEILNLEFVPDFVRRIKHTSSQTRLSRKKRIENIRGAFEINEQFKKSIHNKRLILVDDVVTTGSTINEVIRVLKDSGSSDILACTLAMAR